MHVYPIADRPSGYLLRGRVWLPVIVRMVNDDGSLDVQWTEDGANWLGTVAVGDVRLDE